MFQQFASNYLLGRLYVEPRDVEAPVIQREHQEKVNEQFYGDQPIYNISEPLVMKVDETHLVVQGADDIPEATLAVPGDVIDSLRVRNPPEEKEVLLAKPDANLKFLFKGA